MIQIVLYKGRSQAYKELDGGAYINMALAKEVRTFSNVEQALDHVDANISNMDDMFFLSSRAVIFDRLNAYLTLKNEESHEQSNTTLLTQ